MQNIQWLKEQIWATHESFEKQSNFVNKLRRNDVGINDYSLFLHSIYIIVLEVENCANKYWHLNFGFVDDLKSELSRLPSTQIEEKYKIKFNSKYEILGALYAINGSMKGGLHMQNILIRNPQFTNHTFEYYKQRDENTQWIEEMINSTIFNELDKVDLVLGAKKIFEILIKNQ